jgi:hypothetical protein
LVRSEDYGGGINVPDVFTRYSDVAGAAGASCMYDDGGIKVAEFRSLLLRHFVGYCRVFNSINQLSASINYQPCGLIILKSLVYRQKWQQQVVG